MSDRELMGYAAKAAGLTVQWRALRVGRSAEFGRVKHISWHEGFWLDGQQWSPLDDDGDAFRLAHKLRICTQVLTTMGGKPAGFDVWPHGRGDCGVTEDGNDEASLRRAIVRAAAAIGRGMD